MSIIVSVLSDIWYVSFLYIYIIDIFCVIYNVSIKDNKN